MKIKACTYNSENDTLAVLTTDGMKMCILCPAIEDSLQTDIIGRSKLTWLKDNEPSTYAELLITDKLQSFLDQYAENYHLQQNTIKNQLTEHFNGDKAYAAAIAREIMMYGR
ncbi:DUF6061 family protein [Ruminiclostridium herbifermentans]|jgi:hypothetical protein|nr:DUF6061 family protein [Ruminiclostridium herbifermentans]